MKVKLKYIHCFDILEKEIFEGNIIDFQKDPIHRTDYKIKTGQLYFTPYGNDDRVSAYFKNDLDKIDKILNESHLHLPFSPIDSLYNKHHSHTKIR